ncbi:PorV/PorQ family protein [Porphyromonas sp.]|uniref:PorV/PorQ family protein n=1 Tax=Porphyromonas sp. TaxID=1924944 RepID=UPI0026DAA352|nr:PorV/PorQ family protein [Porphyromonas sp.]MDO4771338.1 PorV/PorQ family protein [Porphyromonas sp.]
MRITHIFSFAAALLLGLGAQAQTRPLPILEINPDARSAAMGNVSLGEAQSNYLYVNPASFLYHDNWLTVSANGELYPKSGDAGRLIYGNASVGMKFAQRHAVYVGYRYLGGLSIKRADRFGEIKKTIKPVDMTYDLGYAFRLNDKLAFYAMGTLTQAHVVKSAFGATFGLGANYRTAFGSDPENPYRVNIGVRVADLGAPLAYSSKSTYSMPSSFAIGGDVSRKLRDIHKFTLALGSRYYFLPGDATLLTAGAGVEYALAGIFSLRGGYDFAQKGMSHYTAGVGISYAGLKADFAYKKATESTGIDTMMCTLSFDF